MEIYCRYFYDKTIGHIYLEGIHMNITGLIKLDK